MFVLLPSPLLGPSSWAPVADALRDAGHRAEVRAVDDVIDVGRGTVLVPHSNAGLYASTLAHALDARATVYVDAALPAADDVEVALAPPDFYAFLEGLADDSGLLPPWTRWWPEEEVAGLFPDATVRARVEDEQPRLPLAYFRRRFPVAPGWAAHPNAYLGFGSTYAAELAFAQAYGWPVRTVDGGHLHQLHDPAEVAATIDELAAACR